MAMANIMRSAFGSVIRSAVARASSARSRQCFALVSSLLGIGLTFKRVAISKCATRPPGPPAHAISTVETYEAVSPLLASDRA
jgi:hypothetical protein